ncbi:MAG: hypothetical protein JSW08_00060 [archaeon]|nr:MAG: hypothetical protein JSW08_00060 [archaeon]
MGTINYYRTGEIIEIIIRDFSGAKIETLKCTLGEKKKYAKILNYLKEKYGFEPEVSKSDFDEEMSYWE